MQNSLVLGTAQIGLDYGIANETGKPDLNSAESIIRTAWENGIQEFDTAQAYGDSEIVLGHIFKKLKIQSKVKVITKPDPTIDHLDDLMMNSNLSQSLDNLSMKKIYCYMLHREDFLNLWGIGLKDIMIGFQENNYIEKIGISVCSPQMALKAIETEGIDCIQIPSNLLDRRFEDAGVFRLADKYNKKLYVRSIFLQGLILTEKDKFRASMEFAKGVALQVETLTSQYYLSRQQLAIGYVKEAYPSANIIFGAEEPSQVSENLECWNKDYSRLDLKDITKNINSFDDRILDPSKWVKK